MTVSTKRLFLTSALMVFTAWLLLSMLVIAFDRHGIMPDKKCAICSMVRGLFSTVPQLDVVPQILFMEHFICFNHGMPRPCTTVFSSSVFYRGPPLLEDIS